MLAHLIYTYDRLDDARVQQEISRALYSEAFGGVHLVHAYNGTTSFGYNPYLEDKLIVRENKGHYRGAVDLINAGLAYCESLDPDGPQFVLVTASDTWAVDVHWLRATIDEMAATGKVLAASSWRTGPQYAIGGFSLDFFIIDRLWNARARIFPLDYDAFYEAYADMLGAVLYTPPIPEAAFQHAYHRHFLITYRDNAVLIERERRFRRIVEREPACVRDNTIGRQRTGIWHSHQAADKKALLLRLDLACGEHTIRLMTTPDCLYFNSCPREPAN